MVNKTPRSQFVLRTTPEVLAALKKQHKEESATMSFNTWAIYKLQVPMRINVEVLGAPSPAEPAGQEVVADAESAHAVPAITLPPPVQPAVTPNTAH